MIEKRQSVLVISDNTSVASAISDALSEDGSISVKTEQGGFAQMNGHAASLAFENDVVVFDADPANHEEIRAIEALLSKQTGQTRFIALTGDDLTLAEATKLRKMGIDEVLPFASFGAELQRAIHRPREALVPETHGGGGRQGEALAVPEYHGGAGRQGEVLAVAQARGGIGATTLAVNLACSLLDRRGLRKKEVRNRVALVDFDLQYGNANVFLDIEDDGAMVELIRSRGSIGSYLTETVMVKHSSGLHVLPAPADFVPLDALTEDRVAEIIDSLRREYDYVVIDMPRAMVNWLAPILSRATRMFVVTDSSVPCMRHAKRIIDFYREDIVNLPVEIVVNHESKPLFLAEHHKEASKLLGVKLTHWIPNDHKTARRAVDLGKPVVIDSSGSAMAKALKNIASATLKSLEVQDTIGR
ncbi:pilus assembly protein CpaE [Rhodovulum iodosum]|uniref:Pilus assembly protein CpaE n=1 Tax=Rhodovulum iodosum TaxID=68291 RepID=A0ABV3XZL4_9RHOB|nr:AAA family ATPase [Rhodovulum robiginosum]